MDGVIGGIVPERMGLLDLSTGEGFRVQFNPERLREKVGAEWKEVAVPGYSYPILYYANTRSHEISLSLKFLAETQQDLEGLTELKRFLWSLVYPVEDGTSPPDVLLIWPGTCRMVIVVTQLDIENEAFNRAGQVTEFTCAFEAKERRQYQLFSSDVRRLGSVREDA